MIRLHILAEGRAELKFVKEILAPHLATFGVMGDVRMVLTSRDRDREFRDGLRRYRQARNDIAAWMKQDPSRESRFSTMFDFYALPMDFPGHAAISQVHDPYQKVAILEQALGDDMADSRFIPYIQLHEFEALILADAGKLDWEYLEHEEPIQRLVAMVGEGNPELINDGPDTAPSKRILAEIPEYDKANAGVIVAERISLAVMRERCQHFREWLEVLEGLH